jgi:SAM-dependent methyltransferase
MGMQRLTTSVLRSAVARLIPSRRFTKRLETSQAGGAGTPRSTRDWIAKIVERCGQDSTKLLYPSQHAAFSAYYEEALVYLEKMLLLNRHEEREIATMRDILAQCLEYTTRTAPHLFEAPNPVREESKQYVDFHKDQMKKFNHSNSIHLELGTYKAFPDEQVEAVVRTSGLAEFIRLDMNPDYAPDIAASCTALPFKDETIDRVCSSSLFEHVAYPHEIIRESFRVLRPGGVLRTIVPFHFVEHGCPSDYLRYTGAFFEEACRNAGFETVVCDTQSSSGLYYTIHTLSKQAQVSDQLESFMTETLRGLHCAVVVLLSLMQPLDRCFHEGAGGLHHSTFSLAVKPGEFRPSQRVRNPKLSFVERNLDLLCCPRTGEDLALDGDRLVTVRTGHEYRIVDGIPNLVTFDGRWSPHVLKAENEALHRENQRLKSELLQAKRGERLAV